MDSRAGAFRMRHLRAGAEGPPSTGEHAALDPLQCQGTTAQHRFLPRTGQEVHRSQGPGR